jgi:hypothetical protein
MSAGRHLERLFADCSSGVVEVRAVPSGQRAWTTIGDWSTLGPFITAAVRARESVLVGLATRCDSTSGSLDNLAELPMLCVDVDTPPDVVRTQLADFPFRYSLFVGSGHGSHLYWKLKEPLDLTDFKQRLRASSLMRRLTAYLGGDDRAANPAIAPRLAGTRNFKYGYPRPVTLIDETDDALNACELEDFLPKEVVRHQRLVLADALPVGARNDMLFLLIRSLRAKGLPLQVVADTVRSVNARHSEEPLPEKELAALLNHALKYPNRSDFQLRVDRRDR